MSESEWDDMVVVGRIVRPHGLRGHVVVHAETDFPDERFQAGQRVFVRRPGASAPSELRVSDARPHLGRLLVVFDGVDGIDEAEALGRGDLRIPAAELKPLPQGQFYHHQLVGCDVVTAEGEHVGVVTAVAEAGAATLSVRSRRGEVLVPLAEDICVEIDVVRRRIVVVPPQGLLDLNVSVQF
jgi:16S rRNA processing protein RimM